MAVCTSSPARAWSATVPPHPNTSSSGWAAITRTRLGERVLIDTGPHATGPRLVTQIPTPQDGAVLLRELEQHDDALAALSFVAAGDHLPACLGHGTHERTEHRPGLDDRSSAVAAQEQRRLPHGPAGPVEPAERPGVGPRERADEVVDLAARVAPADHERDVGLDGAERGEAVRAVDIRDFAQRHPVASAQRAVLDRTGAARAPLGSERDDAVNRRPGLHQGLERRTALGVESDPGEA